MTDDACSLESLNASLGYTKKDIIDTYNKGLPLILQKFGDTPTAENINVETRVYDDKIFDVKEGRLKRTDYLRVKSAINIISEMIACPTGGKTIDGEDYVDLSFLESKQLCLDAINLLREFVIEHGININELNEV